MKSIQLADSEGVTRRNTARVALARRDHEECLVPVCPLFYSRHHQAAPRCLWAGSCGDPCMALWRLRHVLELEVEAGMPCECY